MVVLGQLKGNSCFCWHAAAFSSWQAKHFILSKTLKGSSSSSSQHMYTYVHPVTIECIDVVFPHDLIIQDISMSHWYWMSLHKLEERYYTFHVYTLLFHIMSCLLINFMINMVDWSDYYSSVLQCKTIWLVIICQLPSLDHAVKSLKKTIEFSILYPKTKMKSNVTYSSLSGGVGGGHGGVCVLCSAVCKLLKYIHRIRCNTG